MGGFDLAAEWMGWNNVAHCEWKPFNQQILKYYWPEAISYNDITKSDFTIHRGSIDILTGGFPCQPYSVAGKRKGKEDERHLWPEMLRAIREIQPAWVVGENVRGIINWSEGMVFDEVQAQLEVEGYEVLPFLLPAAGVNAPHERYRTWFVAYSNGRRWGCSNIVCEEREEAKNRILEKTSGARGASNSNFPRLSERISGGIRCLQCAATKSERCKPSRTFTEGTRWEEFPTQSPVCDGNDGLSSQLDGITFSKWRNQSIMSGGNAIVPQVALQIFKSIQQYEKNT